MGEKVDELVLQLLEDAAPKDMTPGELEALQRKIEVFQRAKSS